MIDERAICEKYAHRIREYGLRHLRDRDAASDLVQHVLLSVLQSIRAGRVENLDKLDHYVLGTCRNMAMDMRRGVARQRKLADQASKEMPDVYEPHWPRVDRMRLELCLSKLEPRDRAVVLGTFLEDRDAEEIASSLKISSGNVRVIRHRALARLHGCVEGAAA